MASLQEYIQFSPGETGNKEVKVKPTVETNVKDSNRNDSFARTKTVSMGDHLSYLFENPPRWAGQLPRMSRPLVACRQRMLAVRSRSDKNRVNR